jgi:hypothetical protein
MTGIADQAAFYRAALYLGLMRGETVIAWADDLLTRSTAPQSALIELAMTPAGDLTALRHALLPLSGEALSPTVVDAILGLIAEQWQSGHRSFADTIRVLAQLRHTRLLEAELAEELRRFEFRFHASPTNITPELELSLRQWLARRGLRAVP